MSTPREEWHLDTHRLGRRVLVFDELDSTNTFTAGLDLVPDDEGLAVLARRQTAGRGQHGRTWQCPPDEGVLLSVVLFPPPALRRPALLTAWAAVSVCEAILEATQLQAQIKWPNDVLIRGRKVCGILIEQQAGSADLPPRTVAGIGLNVRQKAESFTAAGLPEAASLAVFTETVPASANMARLLLRHLDGEYHRLLQGDLTPLEACWKGRLGLLGRPVVAECADGFWRGRLLEVAWHGVELELADGERLSLPPEKVQHLLSAGD